MRQDYHDASDKEGRSNVILGKVFSRTSKPFFFFSSLAGTTHPFRHYILPDILL